jgi:hypothetical protein
MFKVIETISASTEGEKYHTQVIADDCTMTYSVPAKEIKYSFAHKDWYGKRGIAISGTARECERYFNNKHPNSRVLLNSGN